MASRPRPANSREVSATPPNDAANDALTAAIEQALRALVGDGVRSVRVRDGRVNVALDGGHVAPAQRGSVETRARTALAPLVGDMAVGFVWLSGKRRRRIIAVASGKGGVGKSTLSTNLALALMQAGRRVGLVDADIYGPSQPRLLGQDGVRPEARDNRLIPLIGPHGLPMLSVGQIVPAEQAIAWRGPMASRALEQLLDAHWDDVETLIVDMPPGTGDVALTMVQRFKPDGAVIVSTPQDLALIDAVRAIALFGEVEVPIVGLVENMAGYICPHCGEASDPFGTGGAEGEAARRGIAFLGRVPLDPHIRASSDAGVPPVAQAGEAGAPYRAIAARIGDWLDRSAAAA